MSTLRCDFSESLTCPRCGYRARRRPTYRVCRTPPERIWRPVPVGDLVEKWLTRVGITKERVERWTRTAGTPEGCGCEARKRWLNEVGNRVQRAVRRKLEAAHHFYFGN